VEILYQLTKLVRKERFESGSLMIEQDDVEFELDNETKMPKSFHLSHKNEAHSLIEELMLISNLLCAKFIYSNLKKYALIRRHPFFNDKNYLELQRYFSVNKIYNREFDDMIEINKILKSLKEKNHNEYLCVQQKLKVLLLRAEYIFAGKFNLEELKHSSLNYDLYTHFTSPIRRYPDMIVHLQLKEIFKYNDSMKPDKSVYKKFEKYSSYMEHINKRYNSARMISLKSKRLFKCLYLKNAPKKKYSALIMDINSINNNNKKGNNNNQGNNFLSNWNDKFNNTNEEDEIVVTIFVPELNLELEWRKSDNEGILFFQYDRQKNEIYLDYKLGNEGIEHRYLKNFDSLQVELFSLDSVPIDVRCKIDFSK
jgi:exoribonuclease II